MSPGLTASSSAFSLNLYGIVIAGISPLISPCLIVASRRSGVMAMIWPSTGNVRSLDRVPPQAAISAPKTKSRNPRRCM